VTTKMTFAWGYEVPSPHRSGQSITCFVGGGAGKMYAAAGLPELRRMEMDVSDGLSEKFTTIMVARDRP
jgi:hypothetical protein